jgi:hypothetical protein
MGAMNGNSNRGSDVLNVFYCVASTSDVKRFQSGTGGKAEVTQSLLKKYG